MVLVGGNRHAGSCCGALAWDSGQPWQRHCQGFPIHNFWLLTLVKKPQMVCMAVAIYQNVLVAKARILARLTS